MAGTAQATTRHENRSPAPHPSRPPRILTVCLRGSPARGERDNRTAAATLAEALELALHEPAFQPLDAVLFPAGCFRLPFGLGTLPYHERARQIVRTSGGLACLAAARRLDAYAPGALLVAGLDARQCDGHDQCCVAFDATGIVGIGRKLFPSADEATRRRPLVCHAQDYASPQRIVTLPNGSRAVLCACYDMRAASSRRPQAVACSTP